MFKTWFKKKHAPRPAPDISVKEWPCPEVQLDSEPHFLFIITPPYSGSTALAQVLHTSHNTAFLQERAEGQWLVPGMHSEERWNPDKFMDWNSIRATWLHRIAAIRAQGQQADIIIEKSPPNMVRLEKLLETFPNHSLLAFNRDPYANSSSILFRQFNPLKRTSDERIDILKRLAGTWLFRSRLLRKWISELDVPYFSYETFCEQPAQCIAMLQKRIPLLGTVDLKRNIQVKDYEKQGIVNQNPRQINNLSQPEIDSISEILSMDRDLIHFFGYTIQDRTDT